MKELNREGWLTELARLAEPLFRGMRLRQYRLTCGWPCRHATSQSRRRVGECHDHRVSAGGVHEIFVSPLLDDSLEVAGTVCHELAHVAAGIDAAHGPKFVRVCRHVGLTKGKPTSVMPGALLEDSLKKIVDKIGSYPHKAIKLAEKAAKQPSDARLTCAECGCRVTISRRWLVEAGLPTCGCGSSFEEV